MNTMYTMIRRLIIIVCFPFIASNLHNGHSRLTVDLTEKFVNEKGEIKDEFFDISSNDNMKKPNLNYEGILKDMEQEKGNSSSKKYEAAKNDRNRSKNRLSYGSSSFKKSKDSSKNAHLKKNKVVKDYNKNVLIKSKNKHQSNDVLNSKKNKVGRTGHNTRKSNVKHENYILDANEDISLNRELNNQDEITNYVIASNNDTLHLFKHKRSSILMNERKPIQEKYFNVSLNGEEEDEIEYRIPEEKVNKTAAENRKDNVQYEEEVNKTEGEDRKVDAQYEEEVNRTIAENKADNVQRVVEVNKTEVENRIDAQYEEEVNRTLVEDRRDNAQYKRKELGSSSDQKQRDIDYWKLLNLKYRNQLPTMCTRVVPTRCSSPTTQARCTTRCTRPTTLARCTTRCTRPTTPRCIRPTTPRCIKLTTPRCIKPTTPRCIKPTTPRCTKPTTPKCIKSTTPRCMKPTTPTRPTCIIRPTCSRPTCPKLLTLLTFRPTCPKCMIETNPGYKKIAQNLNEKSTGIGNRALNALRRKFVRIPLYTLHKKNQYLKDMKQIESRKKLNDTNKIFPKHKKLDVKQGSNDNQEQCSNSMNETQYNFFNDQANNLQYNFNKSLHDRNKYSEALDEAIKAIFLKIDDNLRNTLGNLSSFGYKHEENYTTENYEDQAFIPIASNQLKPRRNKLRPFDLDYFLLTHTINELENLSSSTMKSPILDPNVKIFNVTQVIRMHSKLHPIKDYKSTNRRNHWSQQDLIDYRNKIKNLEQKLYDQKLKEYFGHLVLNHLSKDDIDSNVIQNEITEPLTNYQLNFMGDKKIEQNYLLKKYLELLTKLQNDSKKFS